MKAILLLISLNSLILGGEEMEPQSELKIIEIGHPALRQTARELTEEEILSPSIQELIENMKTVMQGRGVGLAAPQIGVSLQIAVIEDRSEYHQKLSPKQLEERQRSPVPFHVIINPKMHIEEEECVEFFEGCLSIPNLFGQVPRALAVRVDCLNENGQPVTIHAKGWYARILQHEIDHLHGILNLDRMKTQTCTTTENYSTFWEDKILDPLSEVKDQKHDDK